MRAKPVQYKAKEIKNAILCLNSLVALISQLELAEHMKRLIIGMLHGILYVLAKGEPKKDSTNSHTPPSGDITGKRRKAQIEDEDGKKRKKGGQPGHKGTTIKSDGPPDETVDLTPDKDRYENDPNWRKEKTIKRRVIDIRCSKLITDYETDVFVNTETGERVFGEFPEDVQAPVQYGQMLIAQIIHLRETGNVPIGKICEILNGQFGLDICEATVANIIKEAESSPILDEFEEAAEKSIIESPCINADETSVKVNGTKWWAHLLVNPIFTLFFLHKSRGKEAMDAWGILAKFTGTLVHDCWASYFMFTHITHSLCLAHIIRELQAAVEMDQSWAQEMIEHLLDIRKQVYYYGGSLPLYLQLLARDKYREIIDGAYTATGGRDLPRPPGQEGKRGKPAKPKYRNLLERLDTFEDAVLRFMTDKNTPFTNNDAERPVRQLKVHAKISGGFRSEDHARGFCRMRGYLISCKKNGISSYDAITMLMEGRIPAFITEALQKVSPEETKVYNEAA
jgi:transposase